METQKPKQYLKPQAGEKSASLRRIFLACGLVMFILISALALLCYGPISAEQKRRYESQQQELKRVQSRDISFRNLSPTAARMNMYREQAKRLYREDDKEEGDQQISAAIALCPVLPTSASSEADMLSQAYEDRAWDTHKRYLLNRSKPSGLEDQERAVSIAEKSFGPEHEQTIYKIATLAAIYADLGDSDKAERQIQHAISLADSKPKEAFECAWYSYAMLSRIRAVQHEYKAATVAYLHSTYNAKDQSESYRLWDILTAGLMLGQPSADQTAVLTRSLLSKNKFDELDQLGDKLVAEQSAGCNGLWKLDLMMNELDGGPGKSDSQYRQMVYDLNQWLIKNPQSPHARVALAQCHIYNAWAARYSQNENKALNEKLFRQRIEKARVALAGDTTLLKKTPVAYVSYARVAAADTDKDACFKYLNDCRSTWPNYFPIDNWAERFWTPTFFGYPGDAARYIESRARTISGKKGEVEYARLVWNNEQFLGKLFGRESIIKWTPMKSGFMQIMNENPHDMNARIKFMYFASLANDPDAVVSTFDGFQSSTPPLATIKP